MHKLFSVIVILLLVIGCKENSTESSESIIAITDTLSSSLKYITVTLKNETKQVVYLNHCNSEIGVSFERKDSSWVDAGNRGIICLAIYPSGLVPLEPSQSIVDTIFTFPKQTGIYRLKYPYSKQQDGNVNEILLSNEFTYLYGPR